MFGKPTSAWRRTVRGFSLTDADLMRAAVDSVEWDGGALFELMGGKVYLEKERGTEAVPLIKP